MAGGVNGTTGPRVQLPVGAVSLVEQGLVTAHYHLMEVTNARPMVQMTPKQMPATPIHAPVQNGLLI